MLNITPIVLNLIVINVIVFLSGNIIGYGANQYLSLHYIGNGAFSPIQFFSYMFLHANFSHLMGNMLGLFFFGSFLERYWGSKKFLMYYLICGIGAGMLYAGYTYYEMSVLKGDVNRYIAEPGPEEFAELLNKHVHQFYLENIDVIKSFAQHKNDEQYIKFSIDLAKKIYNEKSGVPMLGASGAVFGILLAVGMIFPFMQVRMLFLPVSIPMLLLVSVFGASAVYQLIQHNSQDNVAHFAHLGGMIVGLIMLKIWGEERSNYY